MCERGHSDALIDSPVRLPRVLDQKDLEQEIQVRPQLIGVGIRHLTPREHSR